MRAQRREPAHGFYLEALLLTDLPSQSPPERERRSPSAASENHCADLKLLEEDLRQSQGSVGVVSYYYCVM